jgi:hypothetical protein
MELIAFAEVVMFSSLFQNISNLRFVMSYALCVEYVLDVCAQVTLLLNVSRKQWQMGRQLMMAMHVWVWNGIAAFVARHSQQKTNAPRMREHVALQTRLAKRYYIPLFKSTLLTQFAVPRIKFANISR